MRWTTNRRWSPCSTGTTSRAPIAELLLQRRRDVVARGGGDVDRVERRRLRQPARAVADDQRDVVDLRPREVAPRPARTGSAWRSTRPDVRAERAPAARRGSPSRCRRRGCARGRAAAAARTCGRRRAAGRSSARRRSAAGRCPTPRRRAPWARTGRAGRRGSPPARARRGLCRAACRSAGRRERHAITPPAARTSASARSESPGSTSTPRTALESTVTAKPARSASSAVFLTQ